MSGTSSRPDRVEFILRIAAAAVNFLFLQWLGIRISRVEDPGRVWIAARRSLSQGETVTTDDVDLASARPMRRWAILRQIWPMTGWWGPIRPIRSIGPVIDSMLASAMALATGAALGTCAYLLRSPAEGRSSAETSGDPKITITRRPGIAAERSRCRDCIQPGDRITAAVASRGPDRTSIRVYRGDAVIASCDGCASLSFQISSIGRHVVVGSSTSVGAISCSPDEGSFDKDLAILLECGRIATSNLEAR
jgi:hypothetical protein